MRSFKRNVHDGLVLDDVRDLQFLSTTKRSSANTILLSVWLTEQVAHVRTIVTYLVCPLWPQ